MLIDEFMQTYGAAPTPANRPSASLLERAGGGRMPEALKDVR